MSELVKVTVDAMGGDNAPFEIVKGAVEAVCESDRIKVFLVGQEASVKAELEKYTYDKARIEVVPASEVITNTEHPAEAIKNKPDSSIVVAQRMVKDGLADAFVSAGSTGAVLVGGQLIIKKLKGVKRAPLAPVIPTKKGVSLLIDCGANMDPRPEHLVSFARMGAIYMEEVIGRPNPTVALVNVGAEDEKGNALVKETMPLLKACEDIHFVGSIEARDIPKGDVGVIVCDAFTGNVILKMYEGVASVMFSEIKKSLMSSLKTKIGALLIKPSLKQMVVKFDASEYGGAPMLGLNGLVVKSHGSSKAKDIRICILKCIAYTQNRVSDKISAHLNP